MQWHDEFYATSPGSSTHRARRVRADIERNLRDQGATTDHIADSLAGVDELFDQRLQRGLAAFVYALGCRAARHDETMH